MKILVVQTGFLGDVVLSTAVFENLRAEFPEAEISCLTTPLARPLLEHHNALDRVLVFDKRGVDGGLRGLLRMAKSLRHEGFERVYSLHKSYRTALLLWLAGIPLRFGFREARMSWLYTRTAPRSDLSHDVLRNLAILRTTGVEPERAIQDMSLHVSEEIQSQADKMLDFSSQSPRLIGLAPGSVWATKRWTEEGFAAVADHFSAQGDRVVLIGGPGDAETGRAIEALVKSPVTNLIAKCDLATSIGIVSRLRLLVTNDSAPLHIASARKTPLVAVFCATVPEFGYGPWRVPSRVLGVEGLSCRPCGRHGGNTCPTGTHACQRELTSEMVISAAKELLQSVEAPLRIVNEQVEAT